MKKVGIFIKWVFILVCCAFAGMSASDSSAALTPISPFQAEALPDPSPPVFTFQSSIAYYNNAIIYADSDGKIYAYDLAAKTSTLLSDTSSLGNSFAAVTAFMVSSDDYLYFTDNAVTKNIYRLKLTDTSAGYKTLATGINSNIFSFTENPWTNTIFFSSSDFGSGNNFYLYEIDPAFTTATLRSTFAKKGDNSGNGPIIFEDETTLLYGESVYLGDGYFHQVDTASGAVVQADYLTFTGGLVDATYGYNNHIYVTSGGGKTILELSGSVDPFVVGTTDDEAQGIAYGGPNFYISEMVPFSGGTDDGKISFDKVWAKISPVDPFSRARALPKPNPPVFTFQSSIAYYNNAIIYADSDGKIYAYDLAAKTSTLLSDTSSLGNSFAAVTAFMVSSDDYLYFTDNAVTKNIYRLKLTDTSAGYKTLATGINSNIFSFTENPWTNTIFFSSSDFGSGNNFYLYEIDPAFTTATLRSTFAKKGDNSGNGPIIFEDETTLLYGESVYLGDGYFHQVDTASGAVVQADYLTFTGGLVDATYGYNNHIYVTSGGGKTIFEINGNQKTLLASTYDEAGGITSEGASLFISDMIPYSGSNDDGKIGLLELWPMVPADQRVDDSVDLNSDDKSDNLQPDVILAANTADGSGLKQIGISPVGTDVVVESLEAVAASTIAETVNRPTDFPFDLVNYRLKVTSADGTAQVKVYLSEQAPAGAKWYKYDTIDGWVDYSAHATFSADRQSVTIELKDGDYGDLDRIVNGEIIDPGGIGVTASITPQPSSGGGGGGGGCFIDSTGPGGLNQNGTLPYLLFPVVLLLGVGIVVRLRRE